MSAVSDVKQVEMILRYKKILSSLCCFENQKLITKVILTFLIVTYMCAHSDILAYFYTFRNYYNSLCPFTIDILY